MIIIITRHNYTIEQLKNTNTTEARLDLALQYIGLNSFTPSNGHREGVAKVCAIERRLVSARHGVQARRPGTTPRHATGRLPTSRDGAGQCYLLVMTTHSSFRPMYIYRLQFM